MMKENDKAFLFGFLPVKNEIEIMVTRIKKGTSIEKMKKLLNRAVSSNCIQNKKNMLAC